MIARILALIGLVTLTTGAAAVAAEDSGWVSLFDGKTLAGWKASEHAGSFKVVDGMIAADGDRSHLFYVGSGPQASFKNFELKAEVLARPGANSGVFFHTAFQAEGWPAQGFEVQIDHTQPRHGSYLEMKKTGSLYGVRNVYKQLIQDNEWFTMTISVRAKRVMIRLNDTLVVDYVEPDAPLTLPGKEGRVLSRGTFALQCHDPASQVLFKSLRVKPLPDDLPTDSTAPAPALVDNVYASILKLADANFPLVDFHIHLKGGLTLAEALALSRQTGINYGIAINGGVGFPITNDAGIEAFYNNMKGAPVFIGMQAEGREWPTLFTPAAVAKFDYVFTDGMTIFDHRGQRARLWMKDEVEIPDKQVFMDHLTDTIVGILNNEPIDIYVNPTFIPDVIAAEYDALWTPTRLDRIIQAAAKNGVAVEISSRYRLPKAPFIRAAKQAGVKFTFGTNNGDHNLGRDEYSLQIAQQCGLTWEDMWMPKPEGQKPIQVKKAAK